MSSIGGDGAPQPQMRGDISQPEASKVPSPSPIMSKVEPRPEPDVKERIAGVAQENLPKAREPGKSVELDAKMAVEPKPAARAERSQETSLQRIKRACNEFFWPGKTKLAQLEAGLPRRIEEIEEDDVVLKRSLPDRVKELSIGKCLKEGLKDLEKVIAASKENNRQQAHQHLGRALAKLYTLETIAQSKSLKDPQAREHVRRCADELKDLIKQTCDTINKAHNREDFIVQSVDYTPYRSLFHFSLALGSRETALRAAHDRPNAKTVLGQRIEQFFGVRSPIEDYLNDIAIQGELLRGMQETGTENTLLDNAIDIENRAITGFSSLQKAIQALKKSNQGEAIRFFMDAQSRLEWLKAKINDPNSKLLPPQLSHLQQLVDHLERTIRHVNEQYNPMALSKKERNLINEIYNEKIKKNDWTMTDYTSAVLEDDRGPKRLHEFLTRFRALAVMGPGGSDRNSSDIQKLQSHLTQVISFLTKVEEEVRAKGKIIEEQKPVSDDLTDFSVDKLYAKKFLSASQAKPTQDAQNLDKSLSELVVRVQEQREASKILQKAMQRDLAAIEQQIEKVRGQLEKGRGLERENKQLEELNLQLKEVDKQREEVSNHFKQNPAQFDLQLKLIELENKKTSLERRKAVLEVNQQLGEIDKLEGRKAELERMMKTASLLESMRDKSLVSFQYLQEAVQILKDPVASKANAIYPFIEAQTRLEWLKMVRAALKDPLDQFISERNELDKVIDDLKQMIQRINEQYSPLALDEDEEKLLREITKKDGSAGETEKLLAAAFADPNLRYSKIGQLLLKLKALVLIGSGGKEQNLPAVQELQARVIPAIHLIEASLLYATKENQKIVFQQQQSMEDSNLSIHYLFAQEFVGTENIRPTPSEHAALQGIRRGKKQLEALKAARSFPSKLKHVEELNQILKQLNPSEVSAAQRSAYALMKESAGQQIKQLFDESCGGLWITLSNIILQYRSVEEIQTYYDLLARVSALGKPSEDIRVTLRECGLKYGFAVPDVAYVDAAGKLGELDQNLEKAIRDIVWNRDLTTPDKELRLAYIINSSGAQAYAIGQLIEERIAHAEALDRHTREGSSEASQLILQAKEMWDRLEAWVEQTREIPGRESLARAVEEQTLNPRKRYLELAIQKRAPFTLSQKDQILVEHIYNAEKPEDVYRALGLDGSRSEAELRKAADNRELKAEIARLTSILSQLEGEVLASPGLAKNSVTMQQKLARIYGIKRQLAIHAQPIYAEVLRARETRNVGLPAPLDVQAQEAYKVISRAQEFDKRLGALSMWAHFFESCKWALDQGNQSRFPERTSAQLLHNYQLLSMGLVERFEAFIEQEKALGITTDEPLPEQLEDLQTQATYWQRRISAEAADILKTQGWSDQEKAALAYLSRVSEEEPQNLRELTPKIVKRVLAAIFYGVKLPGGVGVATDPKKALQRLLRIDGNLLNKLVASHPDGRELQVWIKYAQRPSKATKPLIAKPKKEAEPKVEKEKTVSVKPGLTQAEEKLLAQFKVESGHKEKAGEIQRGEELWGELQAYLKGEEESQLGVSDRGKDARDLIDKNPPLQKAILRRKLQLLRLESRAGRELDKQLRALPNFNYAEELRPVAAAVDKLVRASSAAPEIEVAAAQPVDIRAAEQLQEQLIQMRALLDSPNPDQRQLAVVTLATLTRSVSELPEAQQKILIEFYKDIPDWNKFLPQVQGLLSSALQNPKERAEHQELGIALLAVLSKNFNKLSEVQKESLVKFCQDKLSADQNIKNSLIRKLLENVEPKGLQDMIRYAFKAFGSNPLLRANTFYSALITEYYKKYSLDADSIVGIAKPVVSDRTKAHPLKPKEQLKGKLEIQEHQKNQRYLLDTSLGILQAFHKKIPSFTNPEVIALSKIIHEGCKAHMSEDEALRRVIQTFFLRVINPALIEVLEKGSKTDVAIGPDHRAIAKILQVVLNNTPLAKIPEDYFFILPLVRRMNNDMENSILGKMAYLLIDTSEERSGIPNRSDVGRQLEEPPSGLEPLEPL